MTPTLESFRALVFSGIKRALEIDPHCKSYEGTIGVFFPGYFANRDGDGEFLVELACYVLGPSRRYEWRGLTIEEALARATVDVTRWISELEQP